ncbi:MAG TPA: phenylalanine--tRNA ligase subunit beta [Patescibacteria group bacterium]|nr:phenylalanine--tRNA ligase subunit beta [Patescibacteria group bacterium]
MKLPLSWLHDFTDIKKIPAKKIADGLTLSGSEVEHISRRTPDELARFDKVVVGQILEIKKHPNADKLQIATVRISQLKTKDARFKIQDLSIICGAPNIAVGQIVPVALIGAALPNGMAIERRKIRDVESEGMLCSAKELGLAEDAAGIYILSQDLKIGIPLVEALGLDEIVFDLDITPNRGDCLSIRGLAREVSALIKKKPLPRPEFLLKSKSTDTRYKIQATRIDLKVRVEDKKVCSKYSARVIYDAKVGESPQWMKNRLLSVGIRPINNIVDITNYAMMELGQPLHAFDFDKIKSVEIPISKSQFPNKSQIQNSKLKKIIIVRRAKKGERIIALDNKVYELTDDMLVIADAEKPIAIAGIMGGKDSSVNNETKTIILEAAQFDPIAVRKTSKTLNLKSESSYRFERGIDTLRVEQALGRVVELIEQIAGGTRDAKLIDIGKTIKPSIIKTSVEFISNRLGKNISAKEIKQILISLGFTDFKIQDASFKIQVPSWRNDIKIPEDITEEIGRIAGYGNIAPTIFGNDSMLQDNERARRQEIGLMKSINSISNIKDVLIGAGFSECLLYSFYGERHARLTDVSPDDHFQVANPINPDQIYLRTSLTPRLYEAGEKNYNNFPEVRIFEIGRTFLPSSENFPDEQKMLAGILIDAEKSAMDNFREIKGVIEQIGERLNINKNNFQWISEGSRAIISTKDIGGESHKIGTSGIISSNARDIFKIPNSSAFFEISLTKIFEIEFIKKQYKKISEFPASTRDLAIAVEKSVIYKSVTDEIKQTSSLLAEAELFDYFTDEKKIGKGKKSLAFHLIFQSSDRTLTSEEVDGEMKKIIARLEKSLKAEIRR